MNLSIKEQKPYKRPKMKPLVYTLAITLGLTGITGVPKNIYAVEETSQESTQNDILRTLYNNNVLYLNATLANLRKFYEDKDKDDTIKNTYPEAYAALEYIPSEPYDEESLMNSLKEMNNIIRSLRIKPNGTGREPNYGIIIDKTSPLGFRSATIEDQQLIEEYTNILKNPLTTNSELLHLLSLPQENIKEEDLLNTLESLIADQINYLINVKRDLTDFYTNIDTNNIIKEAYKDAYEALNLIPNYMHFCVFNGVDYDIVRDTTKTNKELISEYLTTLNDCNKLVYSLKIKPIGNGREPDYGIIMDQNSEWGFRLKTQEDNALIDDYTNRLGNMVVYSGKITDYLEKVSNTVEKTYSKKYEN